MPGDVVPTRHASIQSTNDSTGLLNATRFDTEPGYQRWRDSYQRLLAAA